MKKTAQIDIKVIGSKSIQDIENELQAVNDQLKTMDINSQAFADMAKQAQTLDGELQNVNKELTYISPAEQADGFLKMGEGIVGAVGAVQGLSAAFGVNNEAMEETIKKLLGLVVAMDGIRKVSEALQAENLAKMSRGFQSMGNAATKGFKAVGTAIQGANVGMAKFAGTTVKGAKIINGALASIALIGIVIAITAIIQNWDKIVKIFQRGDGLNEAEKNLENVTKRVQELNDEFFGLDETLAQINREISETGKLDIFDFERLSKNKKEFDKVLKTIGEINAAKVALVGMDKDSEQSLIIQRNLLKDQKYLQDLIVNNAEIKLKKQQAQTDDIVLFNKLSKIDAELKGQINAEGERITKGLIEQLKTSKNKIINLKEYLKISKNLDIITWEMVEGQRLSNELNIKNNEDVEKNLKLGLISKKQKEDINDYLKTEEDLRGDIWVMSQKVDDLEREKQKNGEDYIKEFLFLKLKMEMESVETSEKEIALQEEAYTKESEKLTELQTQYDKISKTLEDLIFQPDVVNANIQLEEYKLQLDQVELKLNKLRNPDIAPLKPVGIETPDELFGKQDVENLTVIDDKFGLLKQHVYELIEGSEEWGLVISEFSAMYLEPIANEFINITMASADLFAAQQDHIILLAEERIRANQEVIDAEIANQTKLQDQIKENNSEILDYEDLLKDANAERYSEIQAAINEELAANKLLEAQKEAAHQRQLAADAAKLSSENKIAHAEWEIREKDMQASKIAASINGALAVINALGAPFPLNLVLPALIGIATGVQIATINKNLSNIRDTEPPKAAKGMLVGASHAGGGIPIEAEGGEFIINKRSTSEYLPLIEAINNAGNRPKYADGGKVAPIQTGDVKASIDYNQLAYAISRSIKPVVSVVDITNRQNAVKVIESNAGI